MSAEAPSVVSRDSSLDQLAYRFPIRQKSKPSLSQTSPLPSGAGYSIGQSETISILKFATKNANKATQIQDHGSNLQRLNPKHAVTHNEAIGPPAITQRWTLIDSELRSYRVAP